MTYRDVISNIEKLSDKELTFALSVATAERQKGSFDDQDKFNEAIIKNELANRKAIRARERVVNVTNF